tara:strand:- start:53 stop:610 length:558 start_codon:yes stop_codon:yes gene_type:complete
MKSLFNIFKKGTSTYFHEDFYCQVELLPIENLEYLNNENVEVNNFSQEHLDGNGFTDLYERNNNKFDTASKSIDISEFTSEMDNSPFNKVDKVYTGYSSKGELCKNIIAYNLDKSEIFCEFEGNKIKNLFIQGFRFNKDSQNKKELIQTLNQLSNKWNLLLNDWDLCEVINLKDIQAIDLYISEK